jgi:hypothetical protein
MKPFTLGGARKDRGACREEHAHLGLEASTTDHSCYRSLIAWPVPGRHPQVTACGQLVLRCYRRDRHSQAVPYRLSS